jgi:hypothetical protein
MLFASLAILVVCALTQTASLQSPRPAQEPTRGTIVPKPIERVILPPQFARMIESFSEPNGYFDTDNLISNESSYLHVMGKMRKMNVSGGAFIGVGPDQSFSYIAKIRPSIVFITDVRRDNLLQHFWFKALFALSRNRMEYLCLMFGKTPPADLNSWDGRPLPEILAWLDKAPAKRELFERAAAEIQAKVKAFGLSLKPEELATIRRIHDAFFSAGPELKFTSRNRGPRSYYPSYRDLMLEKDLSGRQCNYLVSEDDFRFLQTLEERNLVIPIVGNLAGGQALKQIAQYLKEKGERVSAFYTSNVEFYLMRGYRDDDFSRFAENVKLLPHDANTVIIRSYFNGAWGYSHPQTVSGYYSTQLLQTMESFIREYAGGGYDSYTDLIGKHNLDLK